MTREEIKAWITNNSALMPETRFAPDEIEHMAMCMEHIQEWYYGRGHIGHFLAAVVHNDFRKACTLADTPNRKGLYLYAMFMLNRIPADYMDGDKRLGLTEGKEKHGN